MSDATNWRWHNLPISKETFLLMKKSSETYPWQPEHRRLGETMFYHYKETNKDNAAEMSKKWKSLGLKIRTTKSKDRTIRGVKSGSWLIGSSHYHIWVGI